MNRALVIADDLSGAAEIAGIGRRYGLPTRILREPMPAAHAGLTVLDTDSRSLSPDEAAATVRRFVHALDLASFQLIFKKTDSVLRGPVTAEIGALLDHFQIGGCVFLPQNPRRGRTIASGKYLIDGVPLNQTAFVDDPEYPARSADVADLLSRGGAVPIQGKLTLPNAATFDEMSRFATKFTSAVLPAGGADFFEATLQKCGLSAIHEFETRRSPGSMLFVCGSASAYSRELIARARSLAIPILAIEGLLDRTPGAAARLLDRLVESTAKAMGTSPVTNLMLEGGSTAAAVCRRMRWNELEVCGELAIGVVHLRAGSQDLYIKPGSYPWPDAVWKEN